MVVLYADDDADDLELFGEALRRIDPSITLLKAHSATDALELLNGHVVPDYIFLDINMPVMDGIECLQIIRSNIKFSNLPVTMLSTSQNGKDRDGSQSLDADFITKPSTFDELVNELSLRLVSK